MKNIYSIENAAGVHLCYQVARDEKDAIATARMYGYRSARYAKFIRADG